MDKPSFKKLEKISSTLRQHVIDMLLEAGSGHTAGSLGTADIFAALHFSIMGPEDKFILSNGHICPVLYATLAEKKLIPKKDLWTLSKIGSNLQGHPQYGSLPGIEVTSGSLGQGLSQAIGMSLAAKMNGDKYRVYCMTGDGELNEGQVWEAAMFAGNRKLNNLTWIIDRNNIQIDGHTEEIMPLENLRHKLESFNWLVIEIDGHNLEEIINSFNMAKAVTQRPTAIIAYTIPGKGVGFIEYKVEWHGKTPNKKQALEALHDIRTMKGKIKYD